MRCGRCARLLAGGAVLVALVGVISADADAAAAVAVGGGTAGAFWTRIGRHVGVAVTWARSLIGTGGACVRSGNGGFGNGDGGGGGGGRRSGSTAIGTAAAVACVPPRSMPWWRPWAYRIGQGRPLADLSARLSRQAAGDVPLPDVGLNYCPVLANGEGGPFRSCVQGTASYVTVQEPDGVVEVAFLLYLASPVGRSNVDFVLSAGSTNEEVLPSDAIGLTLSETVRGFANATVEVVLERTVGTTNLSVAAVDRLSGDAFTFVLQISVYGLVFRSASLNSQVVNGVSRVLNPGLEPPAFLEARPDLVPVSDCEPRAVGCGQPRRAGTALGRVDRQEGPDDLLSFDMLDSSVMVKGNYETLLEYPFFFFDVELYLPPGRDVTDVDVSFDELYDYQVLFPSECEVVAQSTGPASTASDVTGIAAGECGLGFSRNGRRFGARWEPRRVGPEGALRIIMTLPAVDVSDPLARNGRASPRTELLVRLADPVVPAVYTRFVAPRVLPSDGGAEIEVVAFNVGPVSTGVQLVEVTRAPSEQVSRVVAAADDAEERLNLSSTAGALWFPEDVDRRRSLSGGFVAMTFLSAPGEGVGLAWRLRTARFDSAQKLTSFTNYLSVPESDGGADGGTTGDVGGGGGGNGDAPTVDLTMSEQELSYEPLTPLGVNETRLVYLFGIADYSLVELFSNVTSILDTMSVGVNVSRDRIHAVDAIASLFYVPGATLGGSGGVDASNAVAEGRLAVAGPPTRAAAEEPNAATDVGNTSWVLQGAAAELGAALNSQAAVLDDAALFGGGEVTLPTAVHLQQPRSVAVPWLAALPSDLGRASSAAERSGLLPERFCAAAPDDESLPHGPCGASMKGVWHDKADAGERAHPSKPNLSRWGGAAPVTARLFSFFAHPLARLRSFRLARRRRRRRQLSRAFRLRRQRVADSVGIPAHVVAGKAAATLGASATPWSEYASAGSLVDGRMARLADLAWPPAMAGSSGHLRTTARLISAELQAAPSATYFEQDGVLGIASSTHPRRVAGVLFEVAFLVNTSEVTAVRQRIDEWIDSGVAAAALGHPWYNLDSKIEDDSTVPNQLLVLLVASTVTASIVAAASTQIGASVASSAVGSTLAGSVAPVAAPIPIPGVVPGAVPAPTPVPTATVGPLMVDDGGMTNATTIAGGENTASAPEPVAQVSPFALMSAVQRLSSRSEQNTSVTSPLKEVGESARRLQLRGLPVPWRSAYVDSASTTVGVAGTSAAAGAATNGGRGGGLAKGAGEAVGRAGRRLLSVGNYYDVFESRIQAFFAAQLFYIGIAVVVMMVVHIALYYATARSPRVRRVTMNLLPKLEVVFLNAIHMGVWIGGWSVLLADGISIGFKLGAVLLMAAFGIGFPAFIVYILRSMVRPHLNEVDLATSAGTALLIPNWPCVPRLSKAQETALRESWLQRSVEDPNDTFWFVERKTRRFRGVWVSRSPTYLRFGDVFGPFKGNMYAWYCLEVLFMALEGTVIGALAGVPRAQATAILSLAVLSLVIMVYLLPYNDKIEQAVQLLIACINVATASITLFIVDFEEQDPAARSWSLVVLWLNIAGIASAAIFAVFATGEVVWFYRVAIRRFIRRLITRHAIRPVQDPGLSVSSRASSSRSSTVPASASSSIASIVMNASSIRSGDRGGRRSVASTTGGRRSVASSTGGRVRQSRESVASSRAGKPTRASRDSDAASSQLFIQGGRRVNISARELLALTRGASTVAGSRHSSGSSASPPGSVSGSSTASSTVPGQVEHLQSAMTHDGQGGWEALLSLSSQASRNVASRDMGGGASTSRPAFDPSADR